MPQSLPLHLYHRQAQITSRERTHTDRSFGELTPASLKTILNDAADGDIQEWIELCKHMTTTDPKLFNKLDIRKRRVIAALDNYEIVPGTDSNPTAQAMAGKAAVFCDNVLGEIGLFENKVLKILDAIGQGVSTTQLLWGRKDGANVITDLEWAHTRRFRWDSDWNLRLYDYGERMQGGEYGDELERDCWLIMLCEEEGAYPGEAGVLRKCAWPWNFKMWVNRFHIHAVERHGQPFITATLPPNATSATKADVLSKLEQLSYDTVGAFEEGTEIVFEGGPSTVNNGEFFEKYLLRADECQAEAVLGATDITTPGENGARAAVETREEATLDPKTITDLALFHGTIKEQIFKPLLRYNMHLFGGVLPPTPRYQDKSIRVPDEASYEVRGGQKDGMQAGLEETLSKQEVSLNGAQIASLVEVLQNVSAGVLPRNSALAIIKVAFNLSDSVASEILGSIGTGDTAIVNPSEVSKTPETITAQPEQATAQPVKKNSTSQLKRSPTRTKTQLTLPLCQTPSERVLLGGLGD